MSTNPTAKVRGAARTRNETQALAHDLVTEYDKRHGPHADLWMLGEFIIGVIRAAWWCLRIVARFPIVSLAVALLGYAYWEFGHLGPALACAVLLAGLLSWRVLDGDSFSEFVTWRVWSNWRAWRTYGRHWDSAMTMAGLGGRYQGDPYVPVLIHARCRPDLDRLTVQLLQGQHPDEFAAAADTLAHTFGMIACRSRIAGPGVVTLEFTRRDRLADVVSAVPLPDPIEPDGDEAGESVEGVA